MFDYRKTQKYKAQQQRKWLRRHGLLPPVEKQPKSKLLLGSAHQRNYARKLLIEQIDQSSWKVWGGENEHILKMEDGTIKCDCQLNIIENRPCSHIIRVLIYKGIMK